MHCTPSLNCTSWSKCLKQKLCSTASSSHTAAERVRTVALTLHPFITPYTPPISPPPPLGWGTLLSTHTGGGSSNPHPHPQSEWRCFAAFPFYSGLSPVSHFSFAARGNTAETRGEIGAEDLWKKALTCDKSEGKACLKQRLVPLDKRNAL